MTQADQLLAGLGRSSGPIIDLGLERVQALLAELGNPQLRLPPTIHIAGTNGKGSLCAYLDAITRGAGLKPHRYISPHLVRFNERIQLAGRDIEDEPLAQYLAQVAAPAEKHGATFFEATTAAAFLAFADTPGDLLILETGLGGRLDATNVVPRPVLTAITPISLDHQEYLGDSLAAIAREKAGILKRGVPVVIGPQAEGVAALIESYADEIDAPTFRGGRDWQVTRQDAGWLRYRSMNWDIAATPGLLGHHQLGNAATAIACAERLAKEFGFTAETVAESIAVARWPARLQPLSPLSLGLVLPPGIQLWLDGGHNSAAGEVLGDWLATRSQSADLVWGMMADKDAAAFLAPMRPYLKRVATVPVDQPRAAEPRILAGVAGGEAFAAPDVPRAIAILCERDSSPRDILIAGSLYLAGEVLSLAEKKE